MVANCCKHSWCRFAPLGLVEELALEIANMQNKLQLVFLGIHPWKALCSDNLEQSGHLDLPVSPNTISPERCQRQTIANRCIWPRTLFHLRKSPCLGRIWSRSLWRRPANTVTHLSTSIDSQSHMKKGMFEETLGITTRQVSVIQSWYRISGLRQNED